MRKKVRIQYETADGIKMYDRQPIEVVRTRVIERKCLKILRIDGEERQIDHINMMVTKRRYLLWTQLPNGTFVFKEDL